MAPRPNPTKSRSYAADELSKRINDSGMIQPGARSGQSKPSKADDDVMTEERLVRVNKSRKQRGLPALRKP